MKIICIGRNYRDHAKELNNPVPSQPLIFLKPATALVKGHRPFYIPDWSDEIHYECEVVLRINQSGKSIPQSEALKFIDAITLGLDYTARDIQNKCKEKGHPWEIAKAFDFSAPIGDWQNFNAWKGKDVLFRLEKNQEIVQEGNTQDLIFSFEYLISYISNYFTLKTGDLIFTGTPAGVGPVKKGDIFEGFLEEEKILLSIIK